MAILKGRPDGGQGGKRGHSNMEHWEHTEEIKLAAKKRRRQKAKSDVEQGVSEYRADAARRLSDVTNK